MKKLAIGGAVAASVLGGSIAVAALTPIGAAFAGNSAAPVAVTAGQDPAGQTGQTGQNSGQAPKGPGRLDQALSDLVKDGTLTQDQADKVRDKLQSSLGRGGGRRPGFGGDAFLKGGLDEVAKSIGIPTDDLKNELKAGGSIADVAKAHNVDPQKVINDLTGAASARIDQAVTSGKLKQEMADQLKSHLNDAISKLVNGQFKGHRPFGPGGRRGPDTNGGGTTPGTPPSGLAPGSTPPGSDAPATTPGSSSPDTSAPAPSGTLGGS